MDGFIKVYRSLFENKLWSDKPFARGQAWIDLLQLANFADTETFIKGKCVVVKRGQLLRSIDSLADRWGWGTRKVRSFLKLLENEKMVTTEGTPNGTLVTIEKYETYNTLGQESGDENVISQSTPQSTPQSTRNKKDKNNKNNRDIYKGVPEEIKPAFMDWVKMRERIKKPFVSEISVTRALNKLDKLAETTEEKIDLIELATERCWLSFYREKETEHETTRNTGSTESGAETDSGYYGWAASGHKAQS